MQTRIITVTAPMVSGYIKPAVRMIMEDIMAKKITTFCARKKEQIRKLDLPWQRRKNGVDVEN